jgi:hypothetical protein
MLGLFDFAKSLNEFVQWVWDFIQQLIAISINFNGLAIVQYVFGNSASLAYKIAIYVFVGVIVFALFVRKMRKNGAIASLQIVILGVVIPLWFLVADEAQNMGDLLKRLVLLIETPVATGDSIISGPMANVTLPVFPVGQVIITLFLTILLAWAGSQFLFLMIGYELLNVVLTVLGLFVFAMYGLGDRTRKFFSVIISLFIVSAVIGLPVALLLTQLAQLLAGTIAGEVEGGVWTTILLFLAAILGLAAQPLLFVVAYRRIDQVVGRVTARIDNKVRSVSENKNRLDAHLAGAQRTTITHRFDQMRVQNTNSAMDKVDFWKSAKVAQITNKISEAASRIAQPAAKVISPIVGTASKASIAIAVIPHPAAKIVSIGAPILNSLVKSIGNKPMPRARERERS